MNPKELKGKLRAAVPRALTAAALRTLDHRGARELYALAAGIFADEIRATVHGMQAHQQELLSGEGQSARTKLRRCTHRLEKGLIMRPRRDVFALDYIGTSAEMYEILVGQQPLDEDGAQLERWARQVLDRFFEVTAAHPTLDAARARYEAARRRADEAEPAARPYARDLETPLTVDYEGMLQLAHRRRSVRWFLQMPVPRDLIDQALQVALQSPSACNRQPFEVRVYDDPALVEELGAIPMGTTGLSHNFPCVLLWVGNLRSFAHHRDRHVPYIDASLAAMAFQFALETLGLASCCINWPDIPKRERRLRRTIHLADDERVVMFMAVGYPDPEGEVPFSQKKSLDAIRSFNKP